MADGFESDRSEAYFSGGMKPRPAPRRIGAAEKNAAEKRPRRNEKSPRRRIKISSARGSFSDPRLNS